MSSTWMSYLQPRIKKREVTLVVGSADFQGFATLPSCYRSLRWLVACLLTLMSQLSLNLSNWCCSKFIYCLNHVHLTSLLVNKASDACTTKPINGLLFIHLQEAFPLSVHLVISWIVPCESLLGWIGNYILNNVVMLQVLTLVTG